MSKKSNLENHEDKYLHITKDKFYGTLVFLLGIALLVGTGLVAATGHEFELVTDIRLRISNIIVTMLGIIFGFGSVVYGLDEIIRSD